MISSVFLVKVIAQDRLIQFSQDIHMHGNLNVTIIYYNILTEKLAEINAKNRRYIIIQMVSEVINVRFLQMACSQLCTEIRQCVDTPQKKQRTHTKLR